jgi:predicted nucleic acid-binding protein
VASVRCRKRRATSCTRLPREAYGRDFDTGAIYALYDGDDLHHAAAKSFVEAETEHLLLPAVLLAEIDYLLTARLDTDAAVDFLDGVQAGAFELVAPSSEDLARCREPIVDYRNLPLGLADATVIASSRPLGWPSFLG